MIDPNGRRSSKLDKILMNIRTALMGLTCFGMSHSFLRIKLDFFHSEKGMRYAETCQSTFLQYGYS